MITARTDADVIHFTEVEAVYATVIVKLVRPDADREGPLIEDFDGGPRSHPAPRRRYAVPQEAGSTAPLSAPGG